MVTTREDGALHFPLTWTKDLVVITNFNFDYVTPTEREAVQFLDEFKVMSYNTMVELDGEKTTR